MALERIFNFLIPLRESHSLHLDKVARDRMFIGQHADKRLGSTRRSARRLWLHTIATFAEAIERH